ncbi:MAG: hypothetical protein M3R08_07920, partial [Bacteroidota bacterium]|nr:hypothetical protein [Bacteroidota bacterium]
WAQSPVAQLDTAVIRIGEQVTLSLSMELDRNSFGNAIEWPVIADTLGGKIEVVQQGNIDTLSIPPDRIQLVQLLKITSFDTGFWAIPPFMFNIAGEQIGTTAMLLEVRSVDLGDQPQLRDIKGIHEVPFNLLSWVRRHWYWIAGALVILAVIVFLFRWWKKRPAKEEHVEIVRVIPLHDRILEQLRALEKDRLWQNGAHKEYHSRLTELIRSYIEERFNVPALESTTDELVHELRVSPIERDQLIQLRNMLELSDMVKFAKAVPSPDENEQMMQGAIRFIQATAATSPQLAHA